MELNAEGLHTGSETGDRLGEIAVLYVVPKAV